MMLWDTGNEDRWRVNESDFPKWGSTAEKLQFLLRYAILAPSTHNTQPWLFRTSGNSVSILADRRRALPEIDPTGRELVMSCGAAALLLCVAMRFFGYRPIVQPLPEGEASDVLVSVRLGERYTATVADESLFRAIPHRQTNRLLLEGRGVTSAVLRDLVDAAAEAGAWLAPIPASHRPALLELIRSTEREAFADPNLRREWAEWSIDSQTYAGLVEEGIGHLPFLAGAINRGRQVAERDQRRSESAPLLTVLGTHGNGVADWLIAGNALAQLQLLAKSVDLWASLISQPVQTESVRTQLAAMVDEQGFPQIVLRFGYGSPPKRTPRRGLREVLLNPR